MTTYTAEEIEKRKADSFAKRAEGKRIAKEQRTYDKMVAQKMHENRRNILFTSPVSGVTLATIRQEDNTVFVFWTVKNQRDRDSFKLAKLWLGRYMEEGNRAHKFMNFMLKVISGEIKVPRGN